MTDRGASTAPSQSRQIKLALKAHAGPGAVLVDKTHQILGQILVTEFSTSDCAGGVTGIVYVEEYVKFNYFRKKYLKPLGK